MPPTASSTKNRNVPRTQGARSHPYAQASRSSASADLRVQTEEDEEYDDTMDGKGTGAAGRGRERSASTSGGGGGGGSSSVEGSAGTNGKRHLSCENCRTRKMRCSRQSPCLSCRMRGDECVWIGRPPGGAAEEDELKSTNDEIERLKKLVDLLLERLEEQNEAEEAAARAAMGAQGSAQAYGSTTGGNPYQAHFAMSQGSGAPWSTAAAPSTATPAPPDGRPAFHSPPGPAAALPSGVVGRASTSSHSPQGSKPW